MVGRKKLNGHGAAGLYVYRLLTCSMVGVSFTQISFLVALSQCRSITVKPCLFDEPSPLKKALEIYVLQVGIFIQSCRDELSAFIA